MSRRVKDTDIEDLLRHAATNFDRVLRAGYVRKRPSRNHRLEFHQALMVFQLTKKFQNDISNLRKRKKNGFEGTVFTKMAIKPGPEMLRPEIFTRKLNFWYSN